MKKQKEYIIVDSNNNWLSTCTSKSEALKKLKKFEKLSEKEEEYENMEVGEDIYVYEALQIN